MIRTVSGVLVCGVAVLALVGCGKGETTREGMASSTTVLVPTTTTTMGPVTTTPYTVPDYWTRVNGPRYITVVVPMRYPAAQMTRVMQDVVDMHSGESGGWHVDIQCGSSAEDTGGVTLGTSSFALDNLGLAQTGLSSKFQAATIIRDGAQC